MTVNVANGSSELSLPNGKDLSEAIEEIKLHQVTRTLNSSRDQIGHEIGLKVEFHGTMKPRQPFDRRNQSPQENLSSN